MDLSGPGVHLFLLSKHDRCFLLTIARSNGVTIKDLNRLKTNTLVSATVSSVLDNLVLII